jgi:maleate isomerase
VGAQRVTHRIGLAVPSSNTTIETEVPEMLGRLAPEAGTRFSFHSSRAVLHDVSEESLDAMVADSDRCARELSDARVDAIVYACLIALMARGAGAHEEIEARLAAVAADNGNPIPVLSSAGALVRALHALGARRIAIITPYLETLTRLVVNYLEGYGITVAEAISLKVSDNVAVGRLDPAKLVPLARGLDLSDVDALVVSACVQMPSLPIIDQVERELGLPVLSTATATVFELLGALGLEARVAEAGSLLAGGERALATKSG